MNGPDTGRRELLRSRLKELGFDAVHFAAVQPFPDPGLREWLAAGNHADMEWLARSADKRLDPQLVLPGAHTAIVLGVNYWPGAQVAPGAFARYALHADYHDTVRPGLVAAGRVVEELYGIGGGDYRYYVDAGPVMERGWAAAAGIGFRGKNGNLISLGHGNWLLLAVILLRPAIPPDEALAAGRAAQAGAGQLCGKCTRCLESCPTAAFPSPGVVDARRCISYHTIENRGMVPRELRPRFGARVFGCDECLAVCPWNRFAQEGRSLLLERRHDLGTLRLLELLRLTPEQFREVFRKTSVKRTKLAGVLRNACIAAGNVWGGTAGECTPSAAPALAVAGEREAAVAELLGLARHEAPVVRAHAVWAVLRILGRAPGLEALAEARAQEEDTAVTGEYAGG
jgi:epoxyqueuosine reductase